MEKNETPRTRNREWGFFGTCVRNGHTDPEAAWDEMMGVLTDPEGSFRFSPEAARDVLDTAWGRHLANEVIGSDFSDFAITVGELARDRRWMKRLLEVTRAIVQARMDSGR